MSEFAPFDGNGDTAIFDGHDLSTLFVVMPVERQLTTWEPSLVQNVVGSIATGTKPQPMEIKLRLTTFSATNEQRLADLRTLAGWLAVDEPKALILTDAHTGTYGATELYEVRDALPTGTTKVDHALNAATVEVTFICPDPRAYEAGYQDGRFWWPRPTGVSILGSGASNTFTVRGTASTMPTFHFYEAHGDAQGRFRIRLMEGQLVRHVLSLGVAEDASSEILIDMEKRTITVDDVTVFDMSFDWFALEPGTTYTVSLVYGDFSQLNISYNPRWW